MASLGKGEGSEALGDCALGRRPGTSAAAKGGWGGGGRDPPSSEGSASMFASDPETRGEEGLYCSHVLAR